MDGSTNNRGRWGVVYLFSIIMVMLFGYIIIVGISQGPIIQYKNGKTEIAETREIGNTASKPYSQEKTGSASQQK